MEHPVVIAGAGLAGLCCARSLEVPYRLLEADAQVGGTAQSFHRGEFVFDVTGHWLHLKDDALRQDIYSLLPPSEWHQIDRRAAIFSHGVMTPYPFQANTYGLPIPVVRDCLLGFFAAECARTHGELPEPKNFEEFIRQRMGDGIAEHFMIPYNTKLWTVPPKDMSHAWCSRFVPLPTAEEVVMGAITPAGSGRSLGYNSTFLYPKSGGIGVLPRALARALPAPPELGHEIVGVDWRARQVTVRENTFHSAHSPAPPAGYPIPYRALVNTMPLDRLVHLLVDPPDEVRDAAAQLRATDVSYWDIGVVGSNGAHDPHWIYFPEADVPFYRVGSPSAAVADLAPPGHRSYYVEVSHPHGHPCPVSDEEVREALGAVGVLPADASVVVWQRSTVSRAYVIMDAAYGEARRAILEFLAEHHIWSVGRYGAWTYDSMEGAMLQGRAAAQEINRLFGAP